jgi:hypothetical protein
MDFNTKELGRMISLMDSIVKKPIQMEVHIEAISSMGLNMVEDNILGQMEKFTWVISRTGIWKEKVL